MDMTKIELEDELVKTIKWRDHLQVRLDTMEKAFTRLTQKHEILKKKYNDLLKGPRAQVCEGDLKE